MRSKILFSALLVALLVACTTVPTTSAPSANTDHIRRDVDYLASAELEGRDTGSEGYRKAAQYVAEQFERMGLVPAGDEGYFQDVPFRSASWNGAEPSFVLKGKSGHVTFRFGEDFIAGPSAVSERSSLEADLVFVGYGIEAPEYNLNDYAGLNVQGKVAVILSGRPESLPSEVGAHYASSRNKRETAARHGAVGYITVYTPEREKRRPFARYAEHRHDDTFDWVNREGNPGSATPGLHPGVMLSSEAAAKLFVGAQSSLESIFSDIEKGQNPKGFPLPYSAALGTSSKHKEITSPNVVAVLPGSDPLLKNEYVVFSAHLDHIGKKEDGQIYYGAQDNAAGIAVMLETARLFVESGHAPRRSLLFVAVTGEEKGLLGSDYFAEYPTVPLQSIVANINLDMPMLLYPFRDIIAFGAEHSSLGQIAERAAVRSGLKLSPDPMPEEVIFVRSDHYNFVRRGIPSIYLITGREAQDPNIDGTAMQVAFLKESYHKPGDAPDAGVNYIAAKQFTEVNYLIAREVADAEGKPFWYEGDFFGELFGR
ncbi:M28 family metallopeptidase [Microbulbifer sp. MLAF003]|uniref:M28 family metallopeptidase n=1 Tax=Microbulbifer TaxID=48073 RepID=UPI00036526CA|nr:MULTISPECIES: M28 family metallopeptidase [Microbulbifer]WHI51171.1 M28 family metallopeptidase [Microbulbifer sp. MLAF003]